MKATTLKGMTVRPEGSQTPTGTVSDLVLDIEERRVTALAISTGEGEVAYILPSEDVTGVDSGAVIARRDAAILPLSDAPQFTPFPTFNQIFNQDATTESGQCLGKLADLEVDPRSWEVSAYDVVGDYTAAFERGATAIPAQNVRAGTRMLMVTGDAS